MLAKPFVLQLPLFVTFTDQVLPVAFLRLNLIQESVQVFHFLLIFFLNICLVFSFRCRIRCLFVVFINISLYIRLIKFHIKLFNFLLGFLSFFRFLVNYTDTLLGHFFGIFTFLFHAKITFIFVRLQICLINLDIILSLERHSLHQVLCTNLVLVGYCSEKIYLLFNFL